LGPDHPATLHNRSHLANLYSESGRLQEAEIQFVECLAGCNRLLGEDHSDTWRVTIDLGLFFADHHAVEQADPYLIKAMEFLRRNGRIEGPYTATYMVMLANAFRIAGRYREAEQVAGKALEICSPDHPEYVGLNILLHAIQDHLGIVRSALRSV